MKKLLEIYNSHKKKILTAVAAGLLYVIAHFGLGLNVDVSQIYQGNVSEIGKQIEDAPE